MESCKKAVKQRILQDMLASIQDATGGGWKVLILDDLTTRILSSALRMSEILECNVSVVEDLFKSREPLPLAAVYFIQPTVASVSRMIEDFSGPAAGLYPSVHVFFSSKVTAEAVNKIKSCDKLMRVIKTLKESNLEFMTIDSRTLVTDHPMALVRLMGAQSEVNSREADRELESIASRLSTLFATINEFPAIRFKAGKAADAADPPGATARSSLTLRFSQKLNERLTAMQRAGQLPNKDTCDMLVLDRSYDPIAPLIHEWTYEPMVYDLLELDGNIFRYKAESQSGKLEEKEMLLDESDELWVELRHAFIAEVYTSLAARFKEFQSKNRAAQVAGGGLKDAQVTTGNIRALINQLPQYREVLSRLSLHIQVSSELKAMTNNRQLTDIGELEQDLVFGDKGAKELINFLQERHAQLNSVDKMRLLACYIAMFPDKLDATKRSQWQALTKLSPQDMAAVCNIAFLGVPLNKPVEAERSSFFNKKGAKKSTAGNFRKKREEDGGYALNRFDPLLRDLVSDLAAGRLSQEEYPYVRPPSDGGTSAASSGDAFAGASAPSARTARPGLNWAKRSTTEQLGSGTRRRLVVFILGGAVRSEMRVVHQLSKSLGRDIMLGSTALDTPTGFLDHLYKISV